MFLSPYRIFREKLCLAALNSHISAEDVADMYWIWDRCKFSDQIVKRCRRRGELDSSVVQSALIRHPDTFGSILYRLGGDVSFVPSGQLTVLSYNACVGEVLVRLLGWDLRWQNPKAFGL